MKVRADIVWGSGKKSYRVVMEYDISKLLTLKVHRFVNAPFNRTDISYVGEVLCLKLFFLPSFSGVRVSGQFLIGRVLFNSPIPVYNYIKHLLCNMLVIYLRHLEKYALKQVLFP